MFETHVGDTFVLGASSWRVEEITHDRVLVTPAPGEPGKMPFWKGDQIGRPIELGLAIGTTDRTICCECRPAAAIERLTRDHDLDQRAADNLLQYLRDQNAATRAVPDATTIVVERVRDELGDWRVCVLSPRGGRDSCAVGHGGGRQDSRRDRRRRRNALGRRWVRGAISGCRPAARSAAAVSRIRTRCSRSSSGSSVRRRSLRPSSARTPRGRCCCRSDGPACAPRSGSSANARPICWPWPSRYGSFPVLLETYRECLRDFFDMPALVETLADVRPRKIRVVTVDSEKPSPFAASLLFSYVASFLYDGDAPLAERRAQALVVDQAQLRELARRRGAARTARPRSDGRRSSAQLQRARPEVPRQARDGLHDMLLVARRSQPRGHRSADRDDRSRRPDRRRWSPARRALPVAHGRRAALRRGRRRRPISRRARRSAAAGRAGGAAGTGARSAWRSGAAICADARAVFRARILRRATGWPRHPRSRCCCV